MGSDETPGVIRDVTELVLAVVILSVVFEAIEGTDAGPLEAGRVLTSRWPWTGSSRVRTPSASDAVAAGADSSS